VFQGEAGAFPFCDGCSCKDANISADIELRVRFPGAKALNLYKANECTPTLSQTKAKQMFKAAMGANVKWSYLLSIGKPRQYNNHVGARSQQESNLNLRVMAKFSFPTQQQLSSNLAQ